MYERMLKIKLISLIALDASLYFPFYRAYLYGRSLPRFEKDRRTSLQRRGAPLSVHINEPVVYLTSLERLPGIAEVRSGHAIKSSEVRDDE